jgi:hypothetical protein
LLVLLVSVRARLALGPGGFGWAGGGGLEGVGGPVVLAVLLDDRVGVVLAAVVDGDADAEGEGGLALVGVAVADAVRAVGGDAELGVEPVEDLFGVADRVALELGVSMSELVGEAGVVVVVAGVQVAAEAVGDLVGRPLLELVAAGGGWGLQVLKQLLVTRLELAVLVGPVQVWPCGWGGV